MRFSDVPYDSGDLPDETYHLPDETYHLPDETYHLPDEALRVIREVGNDDSHLRAGEDIDKGTEAAKLDPKNVDASKLKQPISPEEAFTKESGSAFQEWFLERGLILAAHLLAPGAGAAVQVGFEAYHVVKSVVALASDDPRLIIPLHEFAGLDVEVSVPLGGTAGHALSGATCFIAPDQPSWTGGWALEAPQHADHSQDPPVAPEDQGEPVPPEDHDEAESRSAAPAVADVRRSRPAWSETGEFGCVCDVDLQSIRQLTADPNMRAWILAKLASTYSQLLRASWHPGHVRFIIFVDPVTGEGIWMWLAEPGSSEKLPRAMTEDDREFRLVDLP